MAPRVSPTWPFPSYILLDQTVARSVTCSLNSASGSSDLSKPEEAEMGALHLWNGVLPAGGEGPPRVSLSDTVLVSENCWLVGGCPPNTHSAAGCSELGFKSSACGTWVERNRGWGQGHQGASRGSPSAP